MLKVKDIHKSYGGNSVLCGASLRVMPGECTGLAGRNGSGKSTLIRIIAQVDRADRGDLLCDEVSVLGSRNFLRGRFAYVPQEEALAEFLTVKEQLRFWQAAVGASDAEIISALGVDDLWNKRIDKLSGGQKKRVSIALALQNSPDYIVMDEAFSALDSQFRDELTRILRRKLDEGVGILWCSHDLEEFRTLCSSVLLLKDGVLTPFEPNTI